MRELVRKEMEAGALGIGTSLIYPPAFYAKTEELIELCKVAAKYGGKYISHMRNEGNRLLEALDELIRISREAGLPAEVYHIKAAGQQNWSKIDNLLSRIEAAQKEGLKITANMYSYTAAGTGLRRVSAAMDRRRRLSRVVQAAPRPGHARKNCRGSRQGQR
jgi:N-acyl-D-aspartate/D-glutamate deacylase